MDGPGILGSDKPGVLEVRVTYCWKILFQLPFIPSTALRCVTMLIGSFDCYQYDRHWKTGQRQPSASRSRLWLSLVYCRGGPWVAEKTKSNSRLENLFKLRCGFRSLIFSWPPHRDDDVFGIGLQAYRATHGMDRRTRGVTNNRFWICGSWLPRFSTGSGWVSLASLVAIRSD